RRGWVGSWRCLHRCHEGRYDFGGYAHRPPERLVDNRPLGLRADASLAIGAEEFREPIASGALRTLADPGAGSDAVAFVRRAEVIDLVPHDDPVISASVRGPGDRIPVRDRHLLDPLHPHRIVDVAELVDVLRAGGEVHLEGRMVHFTSVR